MPDLNFIYFAIFLISLIATIHSYFLYPVIIKLISLKKKPKYRILDNFSPGVSVLCSVYNEEKVIRARIENITEQGYDPGKIELLIGSDGSDDSTNKILMDMSSKYPFLKVFIINERRGKAGILNSLVKEAANEILIFTDANTEFRPDAVSSIVKSFSDPDIGGVCGRLLLKESAVNRNISDEEGKYWNYEIFIKSAEGDLGILIGANGGIFAIRKELYTEIPSEKAVTDDLFITLGVLNKNFKFIYEPKAVAHEYTGKTVKDEIRRKIRFAATNFQTGMYFRGLLFHKNLLLSYSIWSHKIIRWFIPALLIAIFLTNLLLVKNNLFLKLFFYYQVGFYLSAAIGYILSLIKIRFMIFSIPYFFVLSNGALLIGFFRFLARKHSLMWQSTPR